MRHHLLASFKCFFNIFLELFAGSGQRDFAAGAVEETRTHLLLQRPDLGGDRRLGAETLLRGAGEAGVPCHLEERF